MPRPLLLTVTGAVTGAQGPSYPHGNSIVVTAQLTALTNSARWSHAHVRCGNRVQQETHAVASAFPYMQASFCTLGTCDLLRKTTREAVSACPVLSKHLHAHLQAAQAQREGSGRPH